MEVLSYSILPSFFIVFAWFVNGNHSRRSVLALPLKQANANHSRCCVLAAPFSCLRGTARAPHLL